MSKTVGTVRRVDDLGRIVIPKEIRKHLGILDGDSLEIVVNDNGEIVYKPFIIEHRPTQHFPNIIDTLNDMCSYLDNHGVETDLSLFNDLRDIERRISKIEKLYYNR